MRIVLLGPPGSGKNALAKRIAEQYGLPIVSCTNLIEWAISEQSELGRLAQDAQSQGRLSDELLLALMRIRMAQADLQKGYVLVDMPRSPSQANVLDNLLKEIGRPIDLIILLDVDTDELMERLVGRITCESCGEEYNIYVNPPIVDGVCDVCGARLKRLPDDYEESIANRLRVYDMQLQPLIDYYQKNGNFQRIPASAAESEVWEAVLALIDATTFEAIEPEPAPEAANKSKEEPAAVSAQVKAVVRKKAAAKKKPASEKPVAKKAAKKAAVKKAAAKKVVAKQVAKKTAAKKAAAKKVVAKKAAAKKQLAKKAVAKKAVAKKAIAKKTSVKKAASRAATKKAATKKVASKKKAVKKAPAKAVKKVIRKRVAKKAPVKKQARKKAPVKKSVVKKSTSKKVVSKKKPPAKKPAVKKAATKKAATKKAATKKVAKKVPVKKVAKKTPVKKVAAKKKRR